MNAALGPLDPLGFSPSSLSEPKRKFSHTQVGYISTPNMFRINKTPSKSCSKKIKKRNLLGR